jgi:hypothetical protein
LLHTMVVDSYKHNHLKLLEYNDHHFDIQIQDLSSSIIFHNVDLLHQVDNDLKTI